MKLYKATITPISEFSSLLQGDTIFGHICWMIFFKYGEDRLQELLKSYSSSPFLVVSDAFVKGYFPKPKMPSRYLNENIDEKKENRKKVWISLEDLQKGNYQNAKKNEEVGNFDKEFENMHNSLNYKTFHTDGDTFAPYASKVYKFSQKDIYFYIDEALFTKNELQEVLTLLSEYGYGKDISLGKGRFRFDKLEKIDIDFISNTFMALSPFVVKDLKAEKIFYEPFTKFGKLGANRAYTNPFKKPIVLAQSGSVIKLKNSIQKPIIGSCISNIEEVYKDVVHQGYAIVIPIKEI